MPSRLPTKTTKTALRAAGGVAWIGLTVLACCGLGRLDFSDSPTDFYASDSPAFERLEAAHERFGPDDIDLVTLLEGEEVLSRRGLLALHQYADALRADPAVEFVGSPLDVRSRLPVGPRNLYLPIASQSVIEGSGPREIDTLHERLQTHPALAGRLIAADGRSMLVVATLGEAMTDLNELAPTVDRLRAMASECFAGLPIRVRMTGPPAVRVDTFHRLKAELLTSSLLGGAVLLLIAAAVFQRVGPSTLALAGPLTGLLWTLGAMGWSGQPLDGMNTVLPSLLFAIGFTDSLHLTLAGSRRTPGQVLAKIGPACLLTSLTTALGFGVLLLSGLTSVQRFGMLAGIGALIQGFAVLGVYALLSPVLGRGFASPRFARSLRRGMVRAGAFTADRPRLLSLAGLAAVAVLAIASRQVAFEMNWTEALPNGGTTRSALEQIDKAFGGSVPARLVVSWPSDASSCGPRTLACLRELQNEFDRLRSEGLPIGRTTSLLTLAEGVDDASGNPVIALQQAAAKVPQQVRRFVAPADRQTVIAIPIADVGARRLTAVFETLGLRVSRVIARHDGYAAWLTGTPVVAASSLGRIAQDLTTAVVFAAIAVLVVLGLAFRSVAIGLATIVPNTLPLLLIMACLATLGAPLRIVVALTLCLAVALGVDDTIHLASSLRRARQRGASPRRCCLAACRQAGVPIVLTTLTLVSVLAVMALSPSPAIRSFCLLGSLSLLASAPAAILLLPAYLLTIAPDHQATQPSANSRTVLRKTLRTQLT